jgi:hypothetical protein
MPSLAEISKSRTRSPAELRVASAARDLDRELRIAIKRGGNVHRLKHLRAGLNSHRRLDDWRYLASFINLYKPAILHACAVYADEAETMACERVTVGMAA